jgi:hypothetical protein
MSTLVQVLQVLGPYVVAGVGLVVGKQALDVVKERIETKNAEIALLERRSVPEMQHMFDSMRSMLAQADEHVHQLKEQIAQQQEQYQPVVEALALAAETVSVMKSTLAKHYLREFSDFEASAGEMLEWINTLDPVAADAIGFEREAFHQRLEAYQQRVEEARGNVRETLGEQS